MKKVLFGLIAMVAFNLSIVAQNATYTKSAMVVLAANAKASFQKGTPYPQWLAAQIGNSTVPTPLEDKVMRDVYGFLSTGATPETIYRSYNGSSILELAKSKEAGGLVALSSSSGRCNFWCQLLNVVLDAVVTFLHETLTNP